MAHQTLNDVWQMIQFLKPSERQQLRAWLDKPPVQAPSSPEQEVERVLFERSNVGLSQPYPVTKSTQPCSKAGSP